MEKNKIWFRRLSLKHKKRLENSSLLDKKTKDKIKTITKEEFEEIIEREWKKIKGGICLTKN